MFDVELVDEESSPRLLITTSLGILLSSKFRTFSCDKGTTNFGGSIIGSFDICIVCCCLEVCCGLGEILLLIKSLMTGDGGRSGTFGGFSSSSST